MPRSSSALPPAPALAARNARSRPAMPRFLGMYIRDWQYLFTVAVVAIVPVIILFSLIEKRLIGGLTAGAVK